MTDHRLSLSRLAAWMIGLLMLLAVYALSLPFAFFWSQQGLPRAVPTLQVIYAPLDRYSQEPNWPGTRTYNIYQSWCENSLRDSYLGPEAPRLELQELSNLQFTETPLRMVASHLATLHDYPIELDDEVDGDIVVTVDLTDTLGDALRQLLEPHGLRAEPDDGRIVIGTPAAIDRIVARRRAANPLVVYGPWILIAIVVLILGAAAQLIRRRKSKHRATG